MNALADQQALDAIDVAGTLRLEGQELAVELPLILGGQAGHMHHAPHARLTGVVADQHGEQLLDVEAIGLGRFAAATDLNTGRIDDQVGNVLMLEAAVEPEAIAARFITAYHSRIGGQSETLAGELNFLFERHDVTGGDFALPGRLA